MTARMSVFLHTPSTIDDVHDSLAEILGRRLERRDLRVGRVYTTTIFDLEMRLFDKHGLDDDCGIMFTNYEYQLELIPLESGLRVEGFDRLYEAITKFLAARLANSLSGQSIVVANLQRQTARFGDERAPQPGPIRPAR